MQESVDVLQGYLEQWGYWAVFFVIMLQNAGVPMPGETILLAAGWAAGRGLLQLKYVLVFGFIGAVIGDNIAYWVGAKGGRPLILKYGKYLFIDEAKFTRAEREMLRHSNWAVFLGSFVSVLRVLAGPVAGTIHMPYHRYVFFDALGVALWVIVIAGLGYLFGEQWDVLLTLMHRFSSIASALAVLIIAGWLLFRFWRKQAAKKEQESN